MNFKGMPLVHTDMCQYINLSNLHDGDFDQLPVYILH